ncbi:MAG: hypothetical protein IJG34_00960 [Synergistaceae bacterium]|nr:hypothetical protein [Synergistaceae bacterium]MBQ3448457.1 hypothetical protein [Synergistaceae bacterium]MBQ3695013.1 hypothetical protein [Synergistaceae bacterium]MBQ9628839.1 hypothetical protein [Synergistaceae bacterium]MBR0069453.1 hypothetical protein [Synergistaceae bacterium]
MPEDNAKDIFAGKTATEIAAYYFEHGHSPEEMKEIMNSERNPSLNAIIRIANSVLPLPCEI